MPVPIIICHVDHRGAKRLRALSDPLLRLRALRSPEDLIPIAAELASKPAVNSRDQEALVSARLAMEVSFIYSPSAPGTDCIDCSGHYDYDAFDNPLIVGPEVE